jgi:hypothetical protein
MAGLNEEIEAPNAYISICLEGRECVDSISLRSGVSITCGRSTGVKAKVYDISSFALAKYS